MAKDGKNGNEEKLISDILAGFIQRNRRKLILCAAAAVVVLAGFIAAVSVRDVLRNRAIVQIEALNDRYEALRVDINKSDKAEEVRSLLEELTAFAGKNSAYAGFRASAIIGSIHGDQKNWVDAEQVWLQAAKKAPKGSYLPPVALYNAAIAAEEAGNLDAAIEHLRESVKFRDDFPAAARAQFAIGRLQETLLRKEEAIAAYRELIEKWSSETIWTNLANSRIIALTGLNS